MMQVLVMIIERYAVFLTISLFLGAVIYMVEITESSSRSTYGQNLGNETSSPTINGTVNQSDQNSGSASPLGNLIIDHAGGGFTSLQTDNDNKTWITTGNWDLVSSPSSANQSNSSSVIFNATVTMRGTDNSGPHEHKISEFKLTNSSIASGEEGSEITFNGTGTIETDIGLYSDVPINIKIYDEGPAIVSIDTQTNEIKPQWIPGGGTIGVLIDERVEDHFGVTPIYGDIKREN
jgi:hypothetical protein